MKMDKHRKIKILMVEDNSSDAELIQLHLRENKLNFTAKVVESKTAYIKALTEFAPDIILSDHRLPQFDSFEALKILKEKNSNVPLILVTGTISEDIAVKMIKEGADNYILKDNLTRLPNAIAAAMKNKKAEDEKEKYQNWLGDQYVKRPNSR